ncbi:MAG: HRDC domain-containing protein, partial [Pyrinomonadaceae bacterium]
AETPPLEPIVLSPEEEITYNALREWRNERASHDGVPPYLIAQNDSLMQIAKLQVGTKEEILQIKGFGEKRTDKYGDEILNILNR